jgi:hypothetical protein
VSSKEPVNNKSCWSKLRSDLPSITVGLIVGLMSCATYAEQVTVLVSNLVDRVDPIPPYRWEQCSETEESTGAVIHLVNKIFSNSGVTTQWTTGPTLFEDGRQPVKDKYQQLQQGYIDFLVTAKAPEPDDPLFSLDVPLVTHRNSLMTLSDNAVFDGTIASLKNYIAGVPYQSRLTNPAFDYINQYQFPLKKYGQDAAGLQGLMAGEIDYWIGDYFVAKLWAHENDLKERILYHEIEVPGRSVYLVTARSSRFAPLLNELNQQLHRYIESGFTNHLYDIYLKEWIAKPCN